MEDHEVGPLSSYQHGAWILKMNALPILRINGAPLQNDQSILKS